MIVSQIATTRQLLPSGSLLHPSNRERFKKMLSTISSEELRRELQIIEHVLEPKEDDAQTAKACNVDPPSPPAAEYGANRAVFRVLGIENAQLGSIQSTAEASCSRMSIDVVDSVAMRGYVGLEVSTALLLDAAGGIC
jgi:hypothetical protein